MVLSAAALVALQVGTALVLRFAQPEAGTAARMTVLLACFLPCLLYVLLAALWLLRMLAELATRFSS
jgi:hypothetical protein